jgi:hypothetical protein
MRLNFEISAPQGVEDDFMITRLLDFSRMAEKAMEMPR